MKLKAYTLIEMLIVFSLLAMFLVCLQIKINPKIAMEMEGQRLFRQLSDQINWGQDQAILHRAQLTINFSSENQSMTMVQNRQLISKVEMVGDWQLQTNYQFYYLPNGRISQFKTIRFYNPSLKQSRQLVFQLGSGKFVIK
ncbi:competence type IV pilus minor pilin ComGD [Vaginisenegalia massiliensis]|uniref:competence type IV pilus minor pilin ComGD n=1 Tax=Vaginisenegalia massiliensis TaxID=2058294 RepID=UPI000F52EF27|nr:competence type IV pilus minor pilin ComGD [Vaginisenegalia massiliensis]